MLRGSGVEVWVKVSWLPLDLVYISLVIWLHLMSAAQ